MAKNKIKLIDALRAIVGLPPVRVLQPVRIISRDAIIRSRIISIMRDRRAG